MKKIGIGLPRINLSHAAVDLSSEDVTQLQLKLGSLRISANESPRDATIWHPPKEASQKSK